MSSSLNPRRWVSQRTQAALAVAATEGSPVTELAPAPQSNSVVETSTQSPLAPRHNSVVEPLPPPPPPPSAPSQHADLWTRLQLALNQLTTAQVDHFATNSATGATRPDFLLIPALYPLHTRHVAFQQRMLHYFVCFPLPRPAASSNKVFVSVFMDSYEALGGDAEFAFWFLLARLIPPIPSAVSANQRGGQHWTPTVSEMWNNPAFLRELEPSLLWPLCPSPERESEYNALLPMDKPLIPAYREAAWLLLADLATRGAYSASVLFEAMARHPNAVGESMMPIVWVQVTASLMTQLQMRNRRKDWTTRDGTQYQQTQQMLGTNDDALLAPRGSELEKKNHHKSDAIEDNALEAMGLLLGGDPGATAAAPLLSQYTNRHDEDRAAATDSHNTDSHNTIVEQEGEDENEGNGVSLLHCNEAGYLLDPNPSRKKMMVAFVQTFGFRIGLFRNNTHHHRGGGDGDSSNLTFSFHTSFRRGGDDDASHALKLITTPQPADLVMHIGDYHLLLVLLKAGLSFDVAHSLIDQYIFVGSRSVKQGALRMYLSTHNEKMVPQVMRLLDL